MGLLKRDACIMNCQSLNSICCVYEDHECYLSTTALRCKTSGVLVVHQSENWKINAMP